MCLNRHSFVFFLFFSTSALSAYDTAQKIFWIGGLASAAMATPVFVTSVFMASIIDSETDSDDMATEEQSGLLYHGIIQSALELFSIAALLVSNHANDKTKTQIFVLLVPIPAAINAFIIGFAIPSALKTIPNNPTLRKYFNAWAAMRSLALAVELFLNPWGLKCASA